MNDASQLWSILRDGASASRLSLADWDLVVRQARHARLLARAAELIVASDSDGGFDSVPEPVRGHLISARVVADRHAQAMRWEVRCVRRALEPLDVPVVLLKGAAYVMSNLPCARGRLFSDIDIMVPKDRLDEVEAALLEAGWAAREVHPYDERYYRRWMHELPPMTHVQRGATLDVHHTILPESGRLRPDSGELFASACRLEGSIHTLAPIDMILHSAAHLFQDGDVGSGLRDLVDLDDLFRHFGREASFWQEFLPRARRLDLQHPAFHALRYTHRLLGTPIPEAVLSESRRDGPSRPILATMDRLVHSAIEPDYPDRATFMAARARWLLYVRSHWLRMPPWLLACHLTRKAFRHWYLHRLAKQKHADHMAQMLHG